MVVLPLQKVTKDSRGTDVILHLKEDETEFLLTITVAPVIGKIF